MVYADVDGCLHIWNHKLSSCRYCSEKGKIKQNKYTCKVKVNNVPVSNTVYKMLKGKWDQDGMQGLGITRYAIFTKKYIKWYYGGKLSAKYEIVSVVKKSNKKYIFKMKSSSGSKFHYDAYVEDGKFCSMAYFTGWSGNDGYSGIGSLHRLSGD